MIYEPAYILSILVSDGIFFHIIDETNALIIRYRDHKNVLYDTLLATYEINHHTYDITTNRINIIDCNLKYDNIIEVVDMFNSIIINPSNSKHIKLIQ